MRLRAFLTMAIALSLAPLSEAAPGKKAKDPSAAPEVQDIVFYGPKRPVLMRLHVYFDGEPFSTRWSSYIKEIHQFADRDKNGTLEGKEIRYVPTVQQMTQMLRGYLYFYARANAKNEIEKMDVDGDDKVTVKELIQFYGHNNLVPLRPSPTYGGTMARAASALSTALFKQLDKNDDKVLSAEELANAHTMVAELDQDEDETIIATEIISQQELYRRPPPRIGGGGAGMMPGMSMGGATGPFYMIPKEKNASRLTERLTFARKLLTRYDKDKSGRLTRDEIGLDKVSFKRLDANKNNVLDSVELLRWIIVRPDIEMVVRLGKRKGKEQPVELYQPQKQQPGFANSVKQVAANTIAIALNGIEIELQSLPPRQIAQTSMTFYIRQLQALDRKKRGYVTLDELNKATATYRYIKPLAELANVNQDEKITFKEIDDYIALGTRAYGCTGSFAFQDHGRGLFQMLDKNGDNRLSGKELKEAGKHLMMHDINKDGNVSEDEIPYQYQMALNAGGMANINSNLLTNPRRPTGTRTGPVWFQKMDRNYDGDISPREFLGSKAKFAELDLNKDEYISLEEAKAIDAKLRKK